MLELAVYLAGDGTELNGVEDSHESVVLEEDVTIEREF